MKDQNLQHMNKRLVSGTQAYLSVPSNIDPPDILRRDYL